MHHIVSATKLTSGEQLAMCGHLFKSYDAAVADGHVVGNYLRRYGSLSEYHTHNVDCEMCIARHMRVNNHIMLWCER